MYLQNDLYTIYGEVLVKKDVEITPGVVKRIREMGKRHKDTTILLKNTAIFSDFRKVFGGSKYANMLNSPAFKDKICEIAGKLEIENDLIFELGTMKSNLPYTYDHVLAVAALATRVALAERSKKYDEVTTLRCGFTHDIGKTRVPISILNKADKLTEKEKSIIQTHPLAGYLMLEYYLKKDRTACSLANLNHHERLDGSGYPKGTRRVDKYAQLISIVDILDALITKRPYRCKAFTLRASLDYLLMQADMGKFDMDLVRSFISLARKDKPDIKTMHISREIREVLPD